MPRYQDRKSRLLVVNLLKELLNKYSSTNKFIIWSLYSFAKDYKHIHSTSSIAKLCLTAFQWSVLLNKNVIQNLDNDVKTSLIEAQAILITIITGCNRIFYKSKAYQFISCFWSQSFPIQDYFQIFSKISPNSDNCIYLFTLSGFVFQYYVDNLLKEDIGFSQFYPFDILLKHLIGTKTELPMDIISRGSMAFLLQLTHKDIKESILPALQRSVLRNPEVVFEFVTYLISALSLDLSSYSSELGKLIGTQLISKKTEFIDTAIVGTRNLAKQCSDSSAIENLLKIYFSILNGSEGKLTIITQRFGILSGIGSLSYHSSSQIEPLTGLVCDHLIAFTKAEVHEATLIHACAQMQLWCFKLSSSSALSPLHTPQSLIDRIKAIQDKSSGVKSAHYACLNAALNSSNVGQVEELLHLLISSAQRSFTATVSQMPIVTESLYALNIILRTFYDNKDLGIALIDYLFSSKFFDIYFINLILFPFNQQPLNTNNLSPVYWNQKSCLFFPKNLSYWPQTKAFSFYYLLLNDFCWIMRLS